MIKTKTPIAIVVGIILLLTATTFIFGQKETMSPSKGGTDMLRDEVTGSKTYTVWAPVGKRSPAIVMKPSMCIGWNSTHRNDVWSYNTYINSELYKGGHVKSGKTVEFSSVTQSPISVTYDMYPKPCNKNG